ncbi:MAG: hypothetical protein AB8G11_15005 [Saprospiraceae bacterium]
MTFLAIALLAQEKEIDLIAMNYKDDNILNRIFRNSYSDNIILSLNMPFFVY